MRRFLLVLACLVSTSLSATEREDKIKTLMEVQGTLTTFQQQIEAGRAQSKEHGKTLLNKMVPDFDPPPEYQRKLNQAFDKYVDRLSSVWGADELVAVWSRYYGDSFTDAELDALIDHYASPLAQKEIVASREALQRFYAHFSESALQIQAVSLQDFTKELTAILKSCKCRKKNKAAVPVADSAADPVESNLKALLAEARDQRDVGDYAGSLESYLKFFEDSRNTSYTGVRLSYVLEELKAMGEDYPPATEALRALRDEREKKLFASRASWDVINEWASLSETLDGNEYIVAVYDQLRYRGNNDPVVLSNVLEQNWEAFIEAGRYPELTSLAFQRYGNLESMAATMGQTENAEVRQSIGDYMVSEYARVYEVFLATNNTADANQLSAKVLDESDSGFAYHALIEAAKSAGRDDLATGLLARAQENLSEAEYTIAENGRPEPEGCDKKEAK